MIIKNINNNNLYIYMCIYIKYLIYFIYNILYIYIKYNIYMIQLYILIAGGKPHSSTNSAMWNPKMKRSRVGTVITLGRDQP